MSTISTKLVLFKISDYTVVYRAENDTLGYVYDDNVDELIKQHQGTDKSIEELDEKRHEFTELYNKYKFPASVVRNVTRSMIDSDYVGYYSDDDDDTFSSDSEDDEDDSEEKLVADGFEILKFMNSKYIGRSYKSTEDWYKTEFLDKDGRYHKQKKYKKMPIEDVVYKFRMNGFDFIDDEAGNVWIFSV
jgi:hypothetical protein